MGRTNQVLTGGSIFSTSPQTTSMKIVLALLVLCLFQFSLAEQEDIDNAETNLVLERDVRDAGKKNCKGKNCRKRGKKSRKERRRKKGGKKSGKRPNLNKKKIKAGRRQNGAARSSSRSASGRNTTGDTCFADLVAKTKKFNKAQVEYRLAKRVQTWGK